MKDVAPTWTYETVCAPGIEAKIGPDLPSNGVCFREQDVYLSRSVREMMDKLTKTCFKSSACISGRHISQ